MSSEDSKSLIELQARNWDKEQKLAIAQLANVALSRLHPTITHDWSRPWQERIYTYLEVTFSDLATCQLSTDQAVQVVTSRIRDIRIDILVDFLAVAMDMDHQGADSTKTTAMVYDARARQFLFQLAYTMKLDLADVAAVERSIAQQMYFALQENSKEKDPNLEDRAAIMDQSAKKAMTETNTKKKAMRWLATGAGVLGGGALIALTGGLAAPLLAPLLVGITGATFFATAGGVALVTSLFGLAGGGLAGWKMHRRMQGLQEFQFQQILSDADLPPIPTLQCTICISGYYLHEKDEFRTPWERGFSKAKNFNDIYCLQYESDALLDLGIAFRKFVKNQALRYAGLEVAKQTALNAFFAAMALPATLLKIADVIDNPWLIAADRSRRAGVVLADILEQRVQGNRPCSLVGYSCGCLVIWHCIQELHSRGKYGLIDNVVFMGAPISCEETEAWLNCLSIVSGRIVNCYTDKDWVLAFVYRLHSLDSQVAGLQPVLNIPRIENVQLHLDGHTEYCDSVQDILDTIHFE